MIKYAFKNQSLTVTGHALYAKHGHDIVCASVSTAIILSSNLINRFNQEKNVEVAIEEGYFSLKVIQETKEVKHIVDNLLWTLEELRLQYPKNITKE